MYERYTAALNAPVSGERLAAVGALKRMHEAGALAAPPVTGHVNNHIHTKYSFSPYSPAMAAYRAWACGLATAGIMDHDSIAGAEEFIEAGAVLGLPVTAGFECRSDFSGTPFKDKRINNPDQRGVAYLTMHGVPRSQIRKAQAFLGPCRVKRNIRNRAMIDKLNAGSFAGIRLDFETEVLPLSYCHDGGGVTERHILFAYAKKIIETAGRGQALINFLREQFDVTVADGNLSRLMDADNAYYDYFLLNLLKGELVGYFYTDADEELINVNDFIRLAEETGAIPAYAYLGDVGDSVTGDKKTQTFEDGYLDELMDYLVKTGFKALTFMPTRNTKQQLKRVMDLCERHGLFQISGEDINSPFQPFICEALALPEYQHLKASAFALIGHEKAADTPGQAGMFDKKTVSAMPSLNERVAYFAEIGKK